MKIKNLALTGGLLATVLTLLPTLSQAADRSGISTANADGVLVLLKDFRAEASRAAVSAEALEAVARNLDTSWQTHAVRLDELKADVNIMGRDLAQLEQIRDSASTIEQSAIDKAAPVLKRLAHRTTAAVKFITADENRTWSPAYRKIVIGVAKDSALLSKTLGQSIHTIKLTNKEKS